MSSENSTWTGITLAQGALAARQGSSDPAPEVFKPSHPLSLRHDTGSVVSKPESTVHSHHFYKHQQISNMVDQWRRSPNEFLGDLPEKCNVAYWIYEKIGLLSPTNMRPFDVVKRRVYMVHYYRLREEFGDIFISPGNTHSLSLFLQHYMPQSVQEHNRFEKNHAAYGTGGKRYHDLATTTKHPGVLFLLTTFSSAQIESKSYHPDIPAAAAIESIAHLGEMGKYDEAAEGIYNVLKDWWTSWLNHIKPRPCSQMPVRDLLSNHKIAEFTRPPPSCHSQTSRLPSTSTASSAVLERTCSIQETAFTAPEAIITAKDIDEIERQFDLRNLQQALVLVPDIRGYGRLVRVPTLTDVLSNHDAGMQLQPPHIVFPTMAMPNDDAGMQLQPPHIVFPAMAMPNEDIFPGHIFVNQETLWPSDIV